LRIGASIEAHDLGHGIVLYKWHKSRYPDHLEGVARFVVPSLWGAVGDPYTLLEASAGALHSSLAGHVHVVDTGATWDASGGWHGRPVQITELLEHLDNDVRANAESTVEVLSRATATPDAEKQRANDLTVNLEKIVEAIVEKKFAERAIVQAELHAAALAHGTHEPGYEAAVAAGSDVRARVLSGPDMLSSTAAAARLSVTRETINQRRQKGALLALMHGSRVQRYPAWQFEPDLESFLPAVLAALSSLDSWTKYFFLTQAHPALDERTPIEAIRRGEIERVVGLAADYAIDLGAA